MRMLKRTLVLLGATVALSACGSDVTSGPQESSAGEEYETVEQKSLSRAFGTFCQRGYENGWQTKLNYAWSACSNFNDELEQTDNKKFYYNLRGYAEKAIETPDDQSYAETVDLMMLYTHGGIAGDQAIWAKWDQSDFINSDDIWLGNESLGQSIFATHSCDTMKKDGRLVERWDSVFSGGLRYALGSHNKLYDGWSFSDQLGHVADNLQDGMSLRYAWARGLDNGWTGKEDAMALTTGKTSSECKSRRKNMKWSNFDNYTRRKSGDVNWYCWTYWNNM